jgi:hypothetical protein
MLDKAVAYFVSFAAWTPVAAYIYFMARTGTERLKK